MKHLPLSILFLLTSCVVHAQIKMHEITYDSIYCYEKRADRVKTNKGGLLSDSNSFITTSNPFVAISIMKKADNDNGVILRLAEMQGKDTEVKMSLPFEVKKVIKTNIIEEVNTKGKILNCS